MPLNLDTNVSNSKKTEMPDVASSSKSAHQSTLDWVGMNNIALPLQVKDGQLPSQHVNAKVQNYVNLNNPQVKGIHMSRLYLLLNRFSQENELTATSLREFLSHLLDSHEDISDKATLHFEFDYVINRPALKSQYSGWKNYPTEIKATLENGKVELELFIHVPYSSTCPCSAALARQLIQEEFHKDFADRETISREEVEQWIRSEKGTHATPHSQRSLAKVLVKLDDSVTDFPITYLIDTIENALQTPVQTAVKREDEQEFARLNGHNLMFCEDAARRLNTALKNEASFSDFWLRVEHLESLHAHDAVAMTTKGVEGGYMPLLGR